MRYRFGPFEFDPQNARVTGPQGDIALRPMTLRLLEQLIDHAPQLLTHAQLLDRVWGRQAVTPGVLSQSVRELRRALGDSAQAPVYIETRHRLGYCFLAPVQRVAGETDAVAAEGGAAAPAGPAAPHAVAAHARRTSVPSARVWFVLAVLAMGAGAWWWLRGVDDGAPDTAFDSADLVRAGHPRDPEARADFADGLRALHQRDLLDAQQRLEQALRREPDAVAARVALADAFAAGGELARAREVAAGLVEATRALPRGAQLRVAAFVADLDYRRDDAIAAWQALFQLDPGDGDAGLRLAAAQLGAGRSDDAHATLQRLAALDASRVDAHRLAMLRARFATARGDHAGALAAARAAFDVATRDEARIDALLQMAAAQLALGAPQETQAALARVDALLDAAPWPDARLRRDRIAATLLRDADDLPATVARHDGVARAARALGNPGAALAAEREAAFTLVHAGRHAEALTRLQALERESATLGDPRLLAAMLDGQQVALQAAGDQAAAEAMARRALAAYVEAHDAAGEASVRSNLGMLYGRDGRDAEAEAEIERALALFRRSGDQRGIAMALGNLAVQYGRAGRMDAARHATEEALATFRGIGAVFDVARLQFNLGVQDRRLGRLGDAERRFREALDGFGRQQGEDFRLQAAATLAELLLARADLAGADAVLATAADSETAAPQRRAAIETARARVAELRGDDEAAEAGFRAAHRLRQTAQLPDWVRLSELDLAELAARRGQRGEAAQVLRRLRREMQASGDALAALQAGVVLAAVLQADGDSAGALRLLDTLDDALADHPDAMLAARVDLVRAATPGPERERALQRVAQDARAIGFELLALRADVLQSTAIAGEARAALARRGIADDAVRPVLAY